MVALVLLAWGDGAQVALNATMTRGTDGSGWNGYTQITFGGGPFGSLVGNTFSFGGTTYEIIDWTTDGGNLRLRLDGGTSASRANAWGSIRCSLGRFFRADATETDNGTFSDYEWAGAGNLPSSGTEDVQVLRNA